MSADAWLDQHSDVHWICGRNSCGRFHPGILWHWLERWQPLRKDIPMQLIGTSRAQEGTFRPDVMALGVGMVWERI